MNYNQYNIQCVLMLTFFAELQVSEVCLRTDCDPVSGIAATLGHDGEFPEHVSSHVLRVLPFQC